MKQNKSSRDWYFRIKDILRAIEKVEQFTQGMSFLEFKKNELVIDAIIRNLEIIGEASNGIPSYIREKHSHVPWKQIIGLRNVLVHEYFGVDLNTVWETVRTYLPILKQQLEGITASSKQ